MLEAFMYYDGVMHLTDHLAVLSKNNCFHTEIEY